MKNFAFPALLMLLVCSPLQADLIVDNFSESGGGGYGLRSTFFGLTSNKVAQEFNTGGRDYRVTSISTMIFRDTLAADFTAELWSSSGGQPDALLGTFTLANNPQHINGYQEYLFRADSDLQLAGSSDYFFAVEDNASNFSAMAGSVFGTNNYTGPGNVLENVQYDANSSSSWASFGPNATLLRVVGNPEPNSLMLLAAAGYFLIGRRRR